MQICSSCEQNKEFSEFYRCKSKPTGYGNECKVCDKERGRIKSKTPRYREIREKWKTKNKDKLLEQNREFMEIYYPKNKERYAESYKRWVLKNADRARELWLKYSKKPSKQQQHKANQAFRRARKLNATMLGYEAEIEAIYFSCPNGHHVDHIIPLINPIVCGLHVPWNLQHLSAAENLKKNNKLILE